jgi:GT2 family glycosyltransferase
VWVVDNGSSDGSVEMVRQCHGWAKLVEPGENLGYGRAVNLVAERTSSPWFALSNADVAMREGALEALLSAGRADPGAGILAPRLILPNGSTQHSAWAFPTLSATLVQNAGSRLAGTCLADRLALAGAWDAGRARRVPWSVGAFLLVRRKAWDDVGGFDEDQWMSAEDLDLGWRMRQRGWATRHVPSALVDHEENAATAQVWTGGELALHWQRCAYSWMLRRMGRPRTAWVGLLNFAGSGTRLLIALARSGFRGSDALRAHARWVLVHAYAFAPRRVLERYR